MRGRVSARISAAQGATAPSPPVTRAGRAPRGSLDPFHERGRRDERRYEVLGGRFLFRSREARLLAAAEAAYAGTPPHRFSAIAPEFVIELMTSGRAARAGREVPALAMMGGGGLAGGVTAGSNLVMTWPEERRALIVASRAMLDSPYHVRYEMVEFAVFTLAARALRLAPLHAACVAHRGRAALLLGDSGSGKSTVSLFCLLRGLEFLAEDAVFVEPGSIRASGVANYLHLRRESLPWVQDAARLRRLRSAPVIRRRSGIEKLEIDLRAAGYRSAPEPRPLKCLLFLSPSAAGPRGLLTALSAREMRRRLAAGQPYAQGQAGWQDFLERALGLPGYELRRGSHPAEAAAAIEEVLCASA